MSGARTVNRSSRGKGKFVAGEDQGIRGAAGPGAQASAADRIDFEAMLPLLPHLLDSLTDAVLVVDRSQRIVAANRRYLEVFGRGQAQVAGAVCHVAVRCPVSPGEAADTCVACEVLRERKPTRRIRILPGEDGVTRRWEATFSPILDRSGEVSHVVEVWRDVSERTRLESQISHNERLASLGILAAGVGHEINNPLASVMAGIESLNRWLERRDFGEQGVAESAEVLQLLEREVTRCRETTDKLMMLAQPYATAPSWVNLNQVIQDTLGLLRFQAREQGVAVSHRLDPELPQIWARDTGMRSVFMNLLMNALQAMEDGGRIEVVTAAHGDRVTAIVEDSGPGIPADIVGRIWDPFFTTKPVGLGTGLGLSVTHRIVTRHGGSIRVEAPPGGGTRFAIDLPVRGSGGADV